MSFFKALARRNTRNPSTESEEKLFRILDREFDRNFGPQASLLSRFFSLFILDESIFRFAPIAAMTLLIVFAGARINHLGTSSEGTMFISSGIDRALLSEGADYEFYDELEDWMLTASDEDWDELVPAPAPVKGQREKES